MRDRDKDVGVGDTPGTGEGELLCQVKESYPFLSVSTDIIRMYGPFHLYVRTRSIPEPGSLT